MSLTYILVALVAVLLNNALVERLNLHTRITTGTRPPAPASQLSVIPQFSCPSLPCRVGTPPSNVMVFNM